MNLDVLDLLRAERARLAGELKTLDDAIGVIEGRLTAQMPAPGEAAVVVPPSFTTPGEVGPVPKRRGYAAHPRKRLVVSLRQKIKDAMLAYGRDEWLTADEITALVPEDEFKRIKSAVYDLSDHGYPLERQYVEGQPTRYRLSADWQPDEQEAANA